MTNRVTNVLRLAAIPMFALSGIATAQSVTPPYSPYPYPNVELETVIVDATADTSVLQLAATRNYGTSRSLDANRTLINVDQAAFRSAVGIFDYVASAKLRITLKPSLLPKLRRTLSAHRVLKAWTEQGATWNCAIDSNTSNLRNDCSGVTDWSQTSPVDAFVQTPSGSTVLPTFRYGTVEIDVTEDVQKLSHNAYPYNGWLLKADGLDLSALDDFASRETSTPPQLVMEIRHCNATICSDGNTCTQELCGGEGFCNHISAPPASCDDNNPCTSNEICSASECVGVRVPAGTPCAEGRVCSALGNCITPPPVSSEPN